MSHINVMFLTYTTTGHTDSVTSMDIWAQSNNERGVQSNRLGEVQTNNDGEVQSNNEGRVQSNRLGESTISKLFLKWLTERID